MIDQAKSKIRNKALAQRDTLSEAERELRSARMSERLFSSLSEALDTSLNEHSGICDCDRRQPREQPKKAPCVALYAPIKSEVDLSVLIDRAEQTGWELVFPAILNDASANDASMAFLRLPFPFRQSLQEFAFLRHPTEKQYLEALEGMGCRMVKPQDIDVMVVPLVAFDDKFRRLGYGGGNYDRFLPQLRDDTLVIGVAFEEQRVKKVPVAEHDQALPFILIA